MRRRTILITGSSGRLGASLVRYLKDHHALVQLDIREPVDPEQKTFGPMFIGPITDPTLAAQAMDGVDAVIHCAAIPGNRKPFDKLIDTNVTGTFCMLEAAGNSKTVEQFIFISSLTWHGLSEHPFSNVPLYLPIDEDHPSLAIDYYSCSKVQAEFWCEKYVKRFRKPVVAVRPPYIVRLNAESEFRASPAPEFPYLNDYIATSDLIEGIRACLDYDPKDGFDRFLFHADDQRSTTPSLDLAARYWPNVPIDREKLATCNGFGALVDTTRARQTLRWTPKFRCKR